MSGWASLITFEKLIRAVVSLPNQPVVAFSSSSTPNWPVKECRDKIDVKQRRENPQSMSAEDEEAFATVISRNDTLGNASSFWRHMVRFPEISQYFGSLRDIFRRYKRFGIQLWSHEVYYKDRCFGPYTQDGDSWSWDLYRHHPSPKGHRLRADHHLFYWTTAFREALVELANFSSPHQARCFGASS